jgi:hypothetical protein
LKSFRTGELEKVVDKTEESAAPEANDTPAADDAEEAAAASPVSPESPSGLAEGSAGLLESFGTAELEKVVDEPGGPDPNAALCARVVARAGVRLDVASAAVQALARGLFADPHALVADELLRVLTDQELGAACEAGDGLLGHRLALRRYVHSLQAVPEPEPVADLPQLEAGKLGARTPGGATEERLTLSIAERGQERGQPGETGALSDVISASIDMPGVYSPGPHDEVAGFPTEERTRIEKVVDRPGGPDLTLPTLT